MRLPAIIIALLVIGGSVAFFMHLSPFPVLNGRSTVIGRIVGGHENLLKLEYYDALEGASVIRKRDHDYPVQKRSRP